jgi:hypothetical protein
MGKLQIAAIILAVGIAIGSAGSWKIQGVRIDSLKVEATKLQQENKACAEANAANVVTVGKLKSEVARAGKLCNARVAAKNDLMARLQRIDEIQVPHPAPAATSTESLEEPVTEVTHETDENGRPPVVAADALLAELNGMFPGKADRPR